MKLRVLIVAVVLAVLFLITGILYAANGDLIVNGNLGVGTTTPQGKAEVNGDLKVDGTLNVGAGGVKFPDGSTQTTAISPTTQNNVAASRVLGTVYQNTTGKPMFVAITLSQAGAPNWAYIYCDSNSNPTTIVGRLNENTTNMNSVTLFFIVLPNYYYKATSANGYPILSWIEWY